MIIEYPFITAKRMEGLLPILRKLRQRGERNPSLEVIFDIAKALGVSSDELLKEIK